MIVSVDHGNDQMKTPDKVFTSGLYVSNTLPPFSKQVLEYRGKYYTLSDKRTPYMRDKTVDETFYILTLFAIGFQIEKYRYNVVNPVDIILLAGLPPAHYAAQCKAFQQYFMADPSVISFYLSGKAYKIRFANTFVFPQTYAASLLVMREICELLKVVVIDIGGYTLDYLPLVKGRVQIENCDSLDNGIIILRNQIKSRVNAQFAVSIEEGEIDAVIRGDRTDYSKELVDLIQAETRSFVRDFLAQMKERKIDLLFTKAVFVGGGAILLKEYILASEQVKEPLFIEKISANAQGYELLYKAGLGR